MAIVQQGALGDCHQRLGGPIERTRRNRCRIGVASRSRDRPADFTEGDRVASARREIGRGSDLQPCAPRLSGVSSLVERPDVDLRGGRAHREPVVGAVGLRAVARHLQRPLADTRRRDGEAHEVDRGIVGKRGTVADSEEEAAGIVVPDVQDPGLGCQRQGDQRDEGRSRKRQSGPAPECPRNPGHAPHGCALDPRMADGEGSRHHVNPRAVLPHGIDAV